MNVLLAPSPPTSAARTSSPPRRVCLVAEAAGGGVGRHFLDLASGLAERGVKVTAIYSPRRRDASFCDRLKHTSGVLFIELAMRRSVGPGDAADLWRLIRQIRSAGPFDLIHGHSSKGGALARLAARWLGIPVLYTPHAFITLDPTLPALKRRLYATAERWLAGWTAALIALSAEEESHARQLGIDPRIVHCVPNGIEPPEFSPRELVRSRLGFGPNEFVVGFVGRLTSQKAPEVTLEAFGKLVQQHPTAKLVVVGDGPLEAQVRQHVARRGLCGSVHLLGDLVATTVMPAFDVFCLSSRYEGMPYVLLEALAAGLPIVATRVGGASLCVDMGKNGFVVEPDDAARLAAALEELAADTSLRERFAIESAARSARFTRATMVDQVLGIYEQIVRNRARAS
jgi:glycosyltransferase involved in cell wall biosynthesis